MADDTAASPDTRQQAAAAAAAAAEAAAADTSLLKILQSLWRDLPGLLSDRVELLALELSRAGSVMLQIVFLIVAVAVTAVTGWLALWGVLMVALVAWGLAPTAVLLLMAAVNAVALMILLARIRVLLPLVTLPATRRHLTVETPQD